jgi:hypothetical protein
MMGPNTALLGIHQIHKWTFVLPNGLFIVFFTATGIAIMCAKFGFCLCPFPHRGEFLSEFWWEWERWMSGTIPHGHLVWSIKINAAGQKTKQHA